MNSKPVSTTHRRQFIKSSSASIGALATVHLTSGLRAASPNDKVSLGIIGPGGMAQMHQPDEFITEEAMDEGLQFLERLLDEMSGRTA